VRWKCLAAGFFAGAAVIFIAGLVGVSGWVLGSYAFAGKGLMIVPLLVLPYLFFAGWTIALRSGALPRDLVFFAAGVHLGVGSPGLLMGDIAVLLFTGVLLVDGIAVVAAAGLWWARHAAPRTLLIWLVVVWILAFVLVAIYHLVLAVTAGAAVAYVERRPARTPLVAGGLAIAVLIMAIVPITATPPV